MTDSFLHLANTYLTANGQLKEGAVSMFLDSLSPEIVNSLEQNDIGLWLKQRFGSNLQWKFIEKTLFSGVSVDHVIEITDAGESYFCKLFVNSENAIREYLAALYIIEQDIPQWRHVPIIRLGKLVTKNLNEFVYVITKKAKGIKGIEYLQRLSKPNSNLFSTEDLFRTLGQVLASVHKKGTNTLSEQAAHSRIYSSFQSQMDDLPPDLRQTIFKDFIYTEFQIAAKDFININRISQLTLVGSGIHFGNFSYSSHSRNIEVFDQGLLIKSFAADAKCYQFSGLEIAFIPLYLVYISHLFRISPDIVLHLQKIFLQAYYPDGLPSVDFFYGEIDVWIKHNFLGAYILSVSKSNDLWMGIVKKEAALYRKNPKAYLARWYPDEK